METADIGRKIREEALRLGYQKCGIVPVGDMIGYGEKLAERIAEYPTDEPLLGRLEGFAEVKKSVPWAESVVVLVKSFGQYRIPEHLKGRIASGYLCGSIHVDGQPDNVASRAFGAYLSSQGLKAETDRKTGFTAMRWAAMKAGLGIIRKNNFFYTETGSSVFLSVWLIDKAIELKEQCTLKPCPEGCSRCINACPTHALSKPYSMRPTACVSFMTGFGGNDLPSHPASPAMGNWIYGCDMCQLACPFNKGQTIEQCEYPGLMAFGEQVSLTKIIDMNYEEIANLFSEKFWYISSERIWKWKVNVLNAMKNDYKEEYYPWIQKACDDSSKQVRAMAAWVLGNIPCPA